MGTLGPVPCRDCGTPVTWNGHQWTTHECRPVRCMTADEWRGWQEANATLSSPAPIPCWDCTATFAKIMRGVYRCNGEPGVVRGPRIVPVIDPIVERRRHRWRVAQRRRRAVVAA